MSITAPTTCGFGKVLLYNILIERSKLSRLAGESEKNFKGRINYAKYDTFQKLPFGMELTYKQFTDNSAAIIKNIQLLGKRYSAVKKEIFEVFSSKNWDLISEKKKEKHALFHCKGCLTEKLYKETLGKFLNKSAKNKVIANKVLHKEEILKNITNTIIDNLDDEFKSTYNTTFTKQLQKQYSAKKKQEVQATARAVLQDIENQFSETSVLR